MEQVDSFDDRHRESDQQEKDEAGYWTSVNKRVIDPRVR